MKYETFIEIDGRKKPEFIIYFKDTTYKVVSNTGFDFKKQSWWLETEEGERYFYDRDENMVFNNEGEVIGIYTRGIPKNFEVGVVSDDGMRGGEQITPSNFGW